MDWDSYKADAGSAFLRVPAFCSVETTWPQTGGPRPHAALKGRLSIISPPRREVGDRHEEELQEKANRFAHAFYVESITKIVRK